MIDDVLQIEYIKALTNLRLLNFENNDFLKINIHKQLLFSNNLPLKSTVDQTLIQIDDLQVNRVPLWLYYIIFLTVTFILIRVRQKLQPVMIYLQANAFILSILINKNNMLYRFTCQYDTSSQTYLKFIKSFHSCWSALAEFCQSFFKHGTHLNYMFYCLYLYISTFAKQRVCHAPMPHLWSNQLHLPYPVLIRLSVV